MELESDTEMSESNEKLVFAGDAVSGAANVLDSVVPTSSTVVDATLLVGANHLVPASPLGAREAVKIEAVGAIVYGGDGHVEEEDEEDEEDEEEEEEDEDEEEEDEDEEEEEEEEGSEYGDAPTT
jgi:hypothetical protein